jgi:hypothetical protein
MVERLASICGTANTPIEFVGFGWQEMGGFCEVVEIRFLRLPAVHGDQAGTAPMFP